jgi:uncharacterized membrane protein (DUF373 family)
VALIEISRKVITLDVKKYEPLTLLGIAALIVTIAIAYYFIKKVRTDTVIVTGSSKRQGIDGKDG